MTRDEFLRRRAVMDFEKTHGLTKCASAPLPPLERTVNSRVQNRDHGRNWIGKTVKATQVGDRATRNHHS